MKLINRRKAIVNVKKLTEYCLNPLHQRGKHKAKVFKSVLGITKNDASFLKEKLLNTVLTEEAEEISNDRFGKRYYIDFRIERNNKSAQIRSIWIIKTGEEIPRFVTCYIK
jgi:Zn-finger domain-containing protein